MEKSQVLTVHCSYLQQLTTLSRDTIFNAQSMLHGYGQKDIHFMEILWWRSESLFMWKMQVRDRAILVKYCDEAVKIEDCKNAEWWHRKHMKLVMITIKDDIELALQGTCKQEKGEQHVAKVAKK